MTTFTPTTPAETLSAVQWALAAESPLEVIGHGSKRGIGRPLQTEHTLDLSNLSGVTLYEPEELVLSARAGTPLALATASTIRPSTISWPTKVTGCSRCSWWNRCGKSWSKHEH